MISRHCFSLLLVGLLFASAREPVAQITSADTITAQMILDRWARALGGREQLARIRGTYTKSRYRGTSGTGEVEEWTSSRAQRRQHNRLDTGEELTVYDGTRGWTRSNGVVRSLSADENMGQRTAAYIGGLSQLVPGRSPASVEYLGRDETKENHVVRITPEGARATTFYINATTWLPTRTVQQLSTARLDIHFEEWGLLDGVRIPRRLRLTTDTGYEAVESITEIRHNESWDPDIFARPADGPADHGIRAGATTVRIPMRYDGQHVMVEGRINDSELVWLMLDTGASGSVLDLEFARSLRLALAGQPTVTGVGGSVQASYAAGLRLTLRDAELRNQTFTVTPLNMLPSVMGRPVVGILGFDLFSRFVVELDYEAREVLLHASRSYEYRGPGAVIPLSLHTNQPYVRASIRVAGRTLDGDYVIDLGSGNTVMLAADYADEHRIRTSISRTIEFPAASVGGPFQVAVGRLEELQLGSFRVSRPLVLFPSGLVTAPGRAGNIGGKVLSRFRVIFDYARERMILEPTTRLSESDEFDMSGLRFTAATATRSAVGVSISAVLRDSPAAEAGVRAGDLLLAVDGVTARDMSLTELRELFRQLDREFSLEVQTGSTRRTVRIRLRRLI